MKCLRQEDGKSYSITDRGKEWFAEMRIDCEQLEGERRTLATQCLDWSEKRSHLGGALGAALLASMRKLGWIATSRVPRLVRLTLKGESELKSKLSIVVGRGSVLNKD
jgi:DNA-binding PadR family transcriptional regulator